MPWRRLQGGEIAAGSAVAGLTNGPAASTGSWCITGGLGGLGLRAAELLYSMGATDLVLCSRRSLTPLRFADMARWCRATW